MEPFHQESTSVKTERVERGIRRLPNGRLQVRVHAGRDPLTGHVRQVSRTVAGGIRAARAARARLAIEVEQGLHGGTRSTLGGLFDAWNAHREKRGASPTTLAEDRRKIDKAIRPALGAKRLDKLSPKDLDDFYGAELARVGERTVLHEHRLIHAALAQGVRWGWANRNVADMVQAPTVRPRESTVPTPAEVRTLIEEAAASRSPELAGIVTVAALTGLREGEICALRFSDVDVEEGTITVRRSVWQAAKGSGVKAQKSRRVTPKPVPLDDLAAGVVRYRREQYEGACAAVHVSPAPDAYVWSRDPLGTLPLMPKALGQAFRRVRKRAGVPARFHDLRHFAATEMVAAGVDMRTVADFMRHGDPSFTLRTYAAGRTEQSRRAAEVLGKALMPAESPEEE